MHWLDCLNLLRKSPRKPVSPNITIITLTMTHAWLTETACTLSLQCVSPMRHLETEDRDTAGQVLFVQAYPNQTKRGIHYELII